MLAVGYAYSECAATAAKCDVRLLFALLGF